MSVEPDFEVVRSSPLAAELSDEECRVLALSTGHRLLRDGEVLIREGEVDHTLHVIISGMLSVEKLTADGERVCLHMMHFGDMVGELGFIDGSGHSATLRAVGETELLSLERVSLEGLLESDPKVVYKVMKAILRTVHAILRRMNLQYVEMSRYITGR